MGFFYFALAFVILFLIIFFLSIFPMLRERKISKGVRNQDTFSQNHLFKVTYTKSDFLQVLNTANVYDALEYDFNNNTMTITFSKYGANIPYAVFIKEFNDGCYIKLSKKVFIGNRSIIPYQINEFMTKKFNAELLPYEEYKDIIK